MKTLLIIASFLFGLVVIGDTFSTGASTNTVPGRIDVLGLLTAGGFPVSTNPVQASWISTSAVNHQLVKVSVYGDSIVAGSYNLPVSSGVWTPEYANNLLSSQVGIGDQSTAYFVDSSAVNSSGAVLSGGTNWTLTGSGGEPAPRFVDLANAGSLGSTNLGFRVEGWLDNSSCVGSNLFLRLICSDSGSVMFLGGDAESTGGYIKVYQTVSGDYWRTVLASTTTLAAGGEMLADTSVVGLIKGLRFYPATGGYAIHNQGLTGMTASTGAATVTNVTKWSPHICFVGLGANDIRNGVTWSAFQSNITALCSALTNASVKPVIANLTPLGSSQSNYYLVPVWNENLRGFAITNSFGYWDRWMALRGDTNYLSDDVHPTKLGYQILGRDLAALLSQAAGIARATQ